MIFDPVLIADRLETMKAKGWWQNKTINDYFKSAIEACPDKIAIAAYRDGIDTPTRLTYRDLESRVERIARALASMGVGRSDVVTFQLPNRWEFIALALACARIGAAANPVMPIFRQHELKFMLNFGESKVFIVPATFRGFNHEAMAREMLPDLPHLQHLVVLDGAGPDSFENRLLRDDTPPLPATPGLDPDDVMLLMYTSGTTGEPKGVMHTSNTLFANVNAYIDTMELGASDVVLGASPMAHLTGYGYLAMLPVILQATTALQEVWNPAKAWDIVHAEGVTFSMASSPFVADLCTAVDAGATPSKTFTKFNCAGAPIPPVVIERAYSMLGMRVSSAWGMTEIGAATITEPARALDKSATSDGKPVTGMEARVVDVNNQPLPSGDIGSLQVRGASVFAGYLKRPHLNGVSKDGWMETGDLAFIDPEGYIRITGRTKDVVIRGGENIPVVEVENMLYKHPAIAQVAVVGFPDKRLGERTCAFVTLKEGETLSFEGLVNYLEDLKLTRQYFPERLEILNQFPATPSGKIQKFKLREVAKDFEDEL